MSDATQSGAEASAIQESPQDELTSLLATIVDGKEPQEDREEEEVAAAEEPSSETDADTKSESEDEPLVTVKVNGQEMQVKQSELVASYQKDSAAQQRFEEAAKIRQSAEAEKAEAVKERQAYTEQLGKYAAQLELMQSQPIDWQALLDNDPQQYLRERHAYDQRQAQLSQAKMEQSYLEQQQQQEQSARQQMFLQDQAQQLIEKIPEWKDNAKAAADKKAIVDYLKGMNMPDEMIANVQDHRAVLMARKAMLYDQLISKQTQAVQKVAKLPPKVERPGVTDAGSIDTRKSALKQLQKSGRIEDAAAAFANFL